MLDKSFRLDAKCDGFGALKDIRNVDMLYGCRVAQEFRKARTTRKPPALQAVASQIEPEYIEGLEKFRLSAEEIGDIEASTSLYKQP
ncbi:MAG: hypothetical protein A3I02_15560 [Betaproteobacteria bacterium RIFCSPLOWO2_02_FULL_67_26]|nr:MAG: hypothetical protein A3I02_15560 [Betaproteobacteria bacterium RIFCSPLOWO2_02_FULL_67_26]